MTAPRSPARRSPVGSRGAHQPSARRHARVSTSTGCAAAAGDDPDVLRLENLDTDIRPASGGDRGDAGGARGRRRQQQAARSTAVRTSSWPICDARRAARRAALRRRGDEVVDHLRARARRCSTRCCASSHPGDEAIADRSHLRGDAQPRATRRGRAAGSCRCTRPAASGGSTSTRCGAPSAAARASCSSTTPSLPDRLGGRARTNGRRSPTCVPSTISGSSTGRGFEAVRYDGREVLHPAALGDMRERTIIVGAPSSEQRMIAWRIGWVGDAREADRPRRRARRSTTACVASGFAQIGTRVALEVARRGRRRGRPRQWQRRRDEHHCGSSMGYRSSRPTGRGRPCSTAASSASHRQEPSRLDRLERAGRGHADGRLRRTGVRPSASWTVRVGSATSRSSAWSASGRASPSGAAEARRGRAGEAAR